MAARAVKASPRSRADAERARLYLARQQWHARGIARRRRDSVIAGVVGALVIGGALLSQVLYAKAPAPAPPPAPFENPFATLFPTAPGAPVPELPESPVTP